MGLLFAVSKLFYKELYEKLLIEGDVSLLDVNPNLPFPESTHADMQIFSDPVSDEVFVKAGITASFLSDLKRANKKVTVSTDNGPEVYPSCCSLNILLCGQYYFHKLAVTDPDVKKHLDSNFRIPVNVNQGYTGCSSCYIDTLDLIITQDTGIRTASSKPSFNCYFIGENIVENISMDGYDHGFIGGCLGYSKVTNTLYVNGSLSGSIPELYELLRSAKVNVVEVPDKPLCDIGGIKTIVYK